MSHNKGPKANWYKFIRPTGIDFKREFVSPVTNSTQFQNLQKYFQYPEGYDATETVWLGEKGVKDGNWWRESRI